ncbi:MAG: hypothetical protein R2751_07655 [Bacteroidales bacterium]
MASHPTSAQLSADAMAQPNVSGALKKIFRYDHGLMLQFFLIIPLVTTGIILDLNAFQWIALSVVTSFFLFAGIARTAAHLQLQAEDELDSVKGSRVSLMGNSLLALTGMMAIFTYMAVFIPHLVSQL